MESKKDSTKSTNDEVNIKTEPWGSERITMEIKPELDSDDGLQIQISPSCSAREYKSRDLKSDYSAMDMEREIKEETWWQGRISSDADFQPESISVLQNQTKNEDVLEIFEEFQASTSRNISENLFIPASYQWNPSPEIILPIKTRKCRSKNIACAINELRQLQDSVNKDISQNQFDVFGQSVAVQLKSFPYYKALLAQSQIQMLLTNIAIETFHSSISSEASETNAHELT